MSLYDFVYIHPRNLPEEVKHIIDWRTEDLGLTNGNFLVDPDGQLRKITTAKQGLAFYQSYYQNGTPQEDANWLGDPQDYDGIMELSGAGHDPIYEGVFEKGIFKGLNRYPGGPAASP